MATDNKPTGWIRKHWLLLIIVAQPLLDVLAFWTQSESGTAAGLIRLALMVLPA